MFSVSFFILVIHVSLFLWQSYLLISLIFKRTCSSFYCVFFLSVLLISALTFIASFLTLAWVFCGSPFCCRPSKNICWMNSPSNVHSDPLPSLVPCTELFTFRLYTAHFAKWLIWVFCTFWGENESCSPLRPWECFLVACHHEEFVQPVFRESSDHMSI